MIHLDSLTEGQFRDMPLVVEGESKEVRYAGDGLVVIRFKPTVYSFTANRAGVIPGSDTLRLRATKVLVASLKAAGIKHAYREVSDKWVLADLLLQPATVQNPSPFRMCPSLPLNVAPPIEVVVKRMHSGTSKHRYYGMSGHPVRRDHPLYNGMQFKDEGAYPEPLIRFDWRNPLVDGQGKRLADEVLGDAQANWFINTDEARKTALNVYQALSAALNMVDVVLYDLCLFISEDGKTVFGEISQDCGRFRHFDHGSLDKDIWRGGGSHADVLSKWALLADLLEKG